MPFSVRDLAELLLLLSALREEGSFAFCLSLSDTYIRDTIATVLYSGARTVCDSLEVYTRELKNSRCNSEERHDDDGGDVCEVLEKDRGARTLRFLSFFFSFELLRIVAAARLMIGLMNIARR